MDIATPIGQVSDRLVVVDTVDLGSTSGGDLRVLDLSTHAGGVMGKSQKPLRLVVFPMVDEWEEVESLREQGHQITRFGTMDVVSVDEIVNADLILGPTCWLMDEAHRKYLPLALAEARRRRYPVKEKE